MSSFHRAVQTLERDPSIPDENLRVRLYKGMFFGFLGSIGRKMVRGCVMRVVFLENDVELNEIFILYLHH